MNYCTVVSGLRKEPAASLRVPTKGLRVGIHRRVRICEVNIYWRVVLVWGSGTFEAVGEIAKSLDSMLSDFGKRPTKGYVRRGMKIFGDDETRSIPEITVF